MNSIDHYKVLGVDKGHTTIQDIKEAYQYKIQECVSSFDKKLVKQCYKKCLEEVVPENKNHNEAIQDVTLKEISSYKSERNSDCYKPPIKELKGLNVSKRDFNNLFENVTTPMYAKNEGAKDFRSLGCVSLQDAGSIGFQTISEYNSVISHDTTPGNFFDTRGTSHSLFQDTKSTMSVDNINKAFETPKEIITRNKLAEDHSSINTNEEFEMYKRKVLKDKLSRSKRNLSMSHSDNTEILVDEDEIMNNFQAPNIKFGSKRN
jgi:hypothetical protein